MFNYKILFTLVVYISFATYAQKILSFDMVEMQIGNEVIAHSNYNDTNLSSSIMSRGAGIGYLDANWQNITGGDLDPGLFNSYGWTTNTSPDLNDYIEFYIKPNSGYEVSIYNITIQHEREANGPTDFVVKTSLDGFLTNVGSSYTIPQVRNRPIVTYINLEISNVTDSLVFRLYGFNASSEYATWGLGLGTHDPFDPPVSDNHIIVNGQVTTANSPHLFASLNVMNDFSYFLGNGPSGSKSFNILGTNLSPSNGIITVNGTSNYELSLDNINFSSSLNLPYSSGSLISTSVYVRLKSNLTTSNYNNENITISGGGANQKQVTCNGFVSAYNLVINEILSDATLIDANNDGLVDGNLTQFLNDQFVEIINIGNVDIDLTNFTLSDFLPGPKRIRHTFSPVTLPVGQAIVVFGGGTITNYTASLFQKASTNRLALEDAGDKVIIADNLGRTVAVYQYGTEGAEDESIARNPDYFGSFVKHSEIITNPSLFSAGKKNTDSSPLPVELESFSAIKLGASVKLIWKTSTEVNNYGFDVERKSVDGTWKQLGFVEGSGNSNSVKEYSYIDATVESDKYIYRLKQIDSDGKYEYSRDIEIDLNVPLEFELSQNYPNPFNPITSIKYSIPEKGEVRLSVYNLLGEEIAILVNEFKEQGVHEVSFEASSIASGVYIYRLESLGNILMNKMILLK